MAASKAKAQMGRPPKDAKDVANKPLTTLLTAAEHAACAAAAGGNLSKWARGVLIRAARKGQR